MAARLDSGTTLQYMKLGAMVARAGASHHPPDLTPDTDTDTDTRTT
jgi:hypothetical protein